MLDLGVHHDDRKTPLFPTKWVDVNNGGNENREIPSRTVARDFIVKRERQRTYLFAVMTPLEAKRFLFLMSASAWGPPNP
jgi:hypothetical protein